jgi:hypothetical protein
MFRLSNALALGTLALLTGCNAVHSAGIVDIVAPQASRPNDWRLIASEVDAARIGGLGESWNAALADARVNGDGKAIAAEGELLDPGAALPRPAPPPGVYHCRVVRLGLTPENQKKALAAFKPFYCYIAVEGPLLTFTKGTGTHRPGGRLWDDSDKRMIFLGSVSTLPDGPLPAYGDNPTSNQVGIVERIGDFRWRMVIPGSTPEAKLDVMELLPYAPVALPAGQGALR